MSEPTFEEALGKLEAVVAQLEGGDLPLDEALRIFEDGVRLARVCAARLEDAEQIWRKRCSVFSNSRMRWIEFPAISASVVSKLISLGVMVRGDCTETNITPTTV